MRSDPMWVCSTDLIIRDLALRKAWKYDEHVSASDFRLFVSANSEKMACLSSVVRDKKGFGDAARRGEADRSSSFIVVDAEKRKGCDDQDVIQLRGFQRGENLSPRQFGLVLRY